MLVYKEDKMSGNTIIGKRKEAYRSAEKTLKRDRVMKDRFRELNAAIPPRKRKTPLTEEEIRNLRTKYISAITIVSERLDTFDTNLKNIKNNQAELKKSKAEYDYLSKLRKTMSKDLKVIDISIKEKKYPTVTQLYENSRADYIELDLSDAKKFGGGMSERLKISLDGEGGKKQDGFFTVSKKGKTLTASVNEHQQKMIDKYGEYAKRFCNSDGYLMMNVLVNYGRDICRKAMFRKDEMFLEGADPFELGMAKNKLKTFFKKLKIKDVTEIQKDICIRTIDQKITDPESYMAFLDLLGGTAKIDNALGIQKVAGINAVSKVDKRNSAMSMMAELIGCGKLVAGSKNLHVRDKATGKVFLGTFMENAEGVDSFSSKADDIKKMGGLTPNNLEGSIGLYRDTANLQILDWLCGNVDRHQGNMFYKFDDNGNVIGLMGIDNDACFGRRQSGAVQTGYHLENMMVIPEKTANMVMAMDQEQLKLMLYGYDLNNQEVNNAVKRLNELKAKLTADKEYFKDKPFGYVEQGRLKVVTDDELGRLSLFGELGFGVPLNDSKNIKQGSKNKNLFQTIAKMSINGSALTNGIMNLRENIFQNCANTHITARMEMNKLVTAMDESSRKTYNPSGAFNNVRNTLNDCMRSINNSAGMFIVQKHNGMVSVNEATVDMVMEKINTAIKGCDDYIATKDTVKIMKKSKTSNSYIRLKLANDSKKYLVSCKKALEEMVVKSNLMDEQAAKFPEIKKKGKKEAKEIRDKYEVEKQKMLGQMNKQPEVKQNGQQVQNASLKNDEEKKSVKGGMIK